MTFYVFHRKKSTFKKGYYNQFNGKTGETLFDITCWGGLQEFDVLNKIKTK